MNPGNKFNKYAHPRIVPSLVSSIDDLAHYGYDLSNDKLLYQKDDILCYRLFGHPATVEYEYDFNRYGFRDKWDLASDKKQIGFFGCSFTFGEFVQSPEIFPNLVANSLEYNAFNFGLPGTSIERVAHILAASSNILDLDYAVVTLPDWHRLMYLSNDLNGVNFLDLMHSTDYNKEINSYRKKIYQFGDDYFIHQTISNINSIISRIKNSSTRLLLSSWDPEVYALIGKIFPDYCIEQFEKIDIAADLIHPGPESHRRYADQIISALGNKQQGN